MSELIESLKKGVRSSSPETTESVATQLARILPVDSVIALHGTLGVGKTTFVRGLARAWGITETIKSPTFNLCTIYEGDRRLIHMDAYRLEPETDTDTLMIKDFLRSPWCFAVEWPDRIQADLPDDRLDLKLSINEDQSHRIQLLR